MRTGGIGGILLKAVRAGHRVVVAVTVSDYRTWEATVGREEQCKKDQLAVAKRCGYEKRFLDYPDRGQIWAALSQDGGHTWSEPRFVFAGILEGGLAPYPSCLYVDLVADGPDLHLFLSQLGAQLVHLTLRESDLPRCPTMVELHRRAAQDQIAKEITVGGIRIPTAAPPCGVKLREVLGLLTAADVSGQIVHTCPPDRSSAPRSLPSRQTRHLRGPQRV